MTSRYLKVGTFAGTFQGNVNQVNGGCWTAYSEPRQTFKRERSSELSRRKSGYVLPQMVPS